MNMNKAKNKPMIRFSKHQSSGAVHIIILIVVAFAAIGALGYHAYRNGQLNLPRYIGLTTPRLVQISSTGGLCNSGVCRSERFILRDGSSSNQETINVNKEDIKILTNLIESTDFEKLRQNKFTKICPTAYDGQEKVYTFYTSHGPEVISSCETEIDPDSPLFKHLYQVVYK